MGDHFCCISDVLDTYFSNQDAKRRLGHEQAKKDRLFALEFGECVERIVLPTLLEIRDMLRDRGVVAELKSASQDGLVRSVTLRLDTSRIQDEFVAVFGNPCLTIESDTRIGGVRMISEAFQKRRSKTLPMEKLGRGVVESAVAELLRETLE